MKVVIVAPYFYPHPGGVEVYTLNIAKQLQKQGWDVVVVTTGEKDNKKSALVEGIKTYYLKPAFTFSNTPIAFGWRRKLKYVFAIEKPDVINAHTPVPFLSDMAQRASGTIPFVLTYHNDLEKDSLPYKVIVKLLYLVLMNRTLRRSTGIIATSEYYLRNSRYLKKYKTKVSIVPPGVDLARFNPNVAVGQVIAKKYKSKRVILFVGSINKSQAHKGLNVLIKAFSTVHASHPDTKLVVIGKGDSKEMYAALAERMGVGQDVGFTGFISDDDLPQYYKLATVFAMPSVNRNEGFGMVYMEASAVGVPVIGANVGGVPYAIQDKQTGLLVRPRNVNDVASALETLLDDPKYARRLGATGASRAAAEFGWTLLAQQTGNTYKRAIKPAIVQVAGYYPPHLGGMERVAQSVSENLAERDYEVRVLTSNVDAVLEKTPSYPNLHIQRFKAFEFAHIPITPMFLPALFRIPKKSIIHLHLAQAFYPELVLLVSKLRGIPYIVHFHLDLQPSGALGKLFLIYKATLLKAVIRHADRVVVFTREQQTFIHNTYGLPLRRIVIIPNGVGSEYFMKPRTYSKKDRTLLYVGRLSRQKRVGILLKTLPLVHQKIKLCVVGSGEEEKQLEQLTKKLDLQNVEFAGYKPPNESLQYYKDADAFVISSEREGMPLVVLEAMAAGLPIIGTDVTGTHEVVKGVGMLVKGSSEATFAKVLNDVLGDEKKLQELSEASFRAAKNYSWDTVMDLFEQLYDGLRHEY